MILLQAAPDADPAMEVLGELDQDRRERFELVTGEFQRIVGQALLDFAQGSYQRSLDSGEVVLHGAVEAFGSERQLRHRTCSPAS